MEEEALVEAVKARRNPALTSYHNNDRREKAWKVVSGIYDWYSILYSNYSNSPEFIIKRLHVCAKSATLLMHAASGCKLQPLLNTKLSLG